MSYNDSGTFKTAGTYDDNLNLISYSFDKSERNTFFNVPPHEIMHFIDHSFSIKDKYIYSNNKVLSDIEYNKMSINEKISTLQNKTDLEDGYTNVEGGAEYNTALIVFDGQNNTYYFSTKLYSILLYLLGYEDANRAFVHNYDINYILSKNGLTNKEITKLEQIVINQNKSTLEIEGISDEFMQLIIKLYNHNYKGDWEEDKQFLLLMNLYLETLQQKGNTKYSKAINNYNELLASLEYKGFVYNLEYSGVYNTIVEADDIYTIAELADDMSGETVNIRIKDNKITYKRH